MKADQARKIVADINFALDNYSSLDVDVKKSLGWLRNVIQRSLWRDPVGAVSVRDDELAFINEHVHPRQDATSMGYTKNLY